MSIRTIRIGHSPDPDDAFLFYALTRGKIPLPEFQITHCLEGIEELNHKAVAGELEMTAISLAAYPYCAHRYLLLPTGASVGDGYGPVLVAREPFPLEDLRKMTVAVPGKLTTANLLLRLCAGSVETAVVPFDEILPAVKEGKFKVGLLIHEGQLTYQEWGLKKMIDLGQWWRTHTRLPVPLGVNVVRRDLGPEVIRQLTDAFNKSLDYAFAHRSEALQYAAQFSRGLDPQRTDRFVGMYVNRYSIDCRPEGAAAMQRLIDMAAEKGLVPRRVPIEFT